MLAHLHRLAHHAAWRRQLEMLLESAGDGIYGIDLAETSLAPHLARMEPFHRRYMVSNKVLRRWGQMVRELPIDILVPQHGAPLAGAAIKEFIEWVESLRCGIDLMSEADYTIPA